MLSAREEIAGRPRDDLRPECRRLKLQALGHEDGIHVAVVVALQNLDALETVLVIKGEGGVVVDRDLQHHHERSHLAQALAGGIDQQSAEAMAAGIGMHVDGDDVAVSLALVMEGNKAGDGGRGERAAEPWKRLTPAGLSGLTAC